MIRPMVENGGRRLIVSIDALRNFNRELTME